MESSWENENCDTRIEVKRRNRKKNPVVGRLVTKNGNVLAVAVGPTFAHLQSKLRKSGLVPTSIAINKKGHTYFNRR